jgi:hypothetical protein
MRRGTWREERGDRNVAGEIVKKIITGHDAGYSSGLFNGFLRKALILRDAWFVSTGIRMCLA